MICFGGVPPPHRDRRSGAGATRRDGGPAVPFRRSVASQASSNKSCHVHSWPDRPVRPALGAPRWSLGDVSFLMLFGAVKRGFPKAEADQQRERESHQGLEGRVGSKDPPKSIHRASREKKAETD